MFFSHRSIKKKLTRLIRKNVEIIITTSSALHGADSWHLLLFFYSHINGSATTGKGDAQLRCRRTVCRPGTCHVSQPAETLNFSWTPGLRSNRVLAASSLLSIPLSTPRLVGGCLPSSDFCKADLDHNHPPEARHHLLSSYPLFTRSLTPKPFDYLLLSYPSVARGTFNHGTSAPQHANEPRNISATCESC